MNLIKLIDKSIKSYYNPYELFKWPESLPNTMWMSPELVSLYNTPFYDLLTEEKKKQISQLECVNFFSLNVYGIKDLILKVIDLMYTSKFEEFNEYFHHFIGEENEHMWFFAQFCMRYGGKIYQPKSLEIHTFSELDIQHITIFAKILIFEEIGDYYNVFMMNDKRLPETVQMVNRVHHEDESRHIAMGRQLISQLFKEVKKKYNRQKIKEISNYIRDFVVLSIEKLYNPIIYRELGLKDTLSIRSHLLKSEEKNLFHCRVIKKIESFLQREEILDKKIYS